MNRINILSFLVVLGGIGVVLATSARSQLGTPKAYVNLQPMTPGTTQSGHANVSGTVRAGNLVGDGAGVTNVNASLFSGMSSSAFAQVGNANTWTGINTFSNAGNSFTGNGAGVTNVNAAQLGGLASSAFGRLGTANVWTAGNTFSGAGNSFSGIGAGLTGVNADLLDGINSTAFLQGVPNPLVLISAVSGNATIRGENTNANGVGVIGWVTATTGVNSGGDFRTSSPTGRGVYGNAASASGINYGGYFTSTSSGGTGAYGFAPSYGGYFQSDGTTGKGIYGYASSATGNTSGVIGESASPTGKGVQGHVLTTTGINYGGFFQSFSVNGRGVYGSGGAATGANYGVYGQSASVSGIGTLGWASSTTGTTYGVVGESTSVGGRGVYGHALATSGATVGVYGTSHSSVGKGIFGEVIATTGTNYSVQGLQSASIDGWAVFASGDFGASGNKAFRIDHPFDPENKYLLHYTSESPFPQNFYSGNVSTDSKGYAWVELPDYFEAINANFKYQLTVIDTSDREEFVWAKVVVEIQGNRFKIRSNKAGIKVSWRVESDRNDAYNQYRRPREVVEKQGIERGTYQHPEIYGMPPERGLNYGRTRKAQGHDN